MGVVWGVASSPVILYQKVGNYANDDDHVLGNGKNSHPKEKDMTNECTKDITDLLLNSPALEACCCHYSL